MSGVDQMERAVRALRASGNGTQRQRETIRARVLFAATNRRRATRTVVRWVVPLAATLAFSSAWAALHGHLGRSWRAMRDAFGTQGEMAPPPPIVHARVAMSAMPEAAPPRVATDDLPLAPAPRAATARPTGSARAASASSANASLAAPPSSEADVLYAAAHRAHFVDRDPIAAIAAWDAYLRVAPDGPLVPEAQYNRALALVRVGRRAEASAALRPFVEGRYGSYRQREATQIVDALDRKR